MTRNPGERGRQKLTRLWWSSLPLRVVLTTFTASCVVLVLAGVLLVQQATAGIVETKRTASIREASGMHRFMQRQLQAPERLGMATYEQLSRLVELAEAQAAQYLVIVEGQALFCPRDLEQGHRHRASDWTRFRRICASR